MTFSVDLFTITSITPHPDADRLDIVHYGGYSAVVPRNFFKEGDKAIYIPEGALVPDSILAKENLACKLAGPQKNRVKAISLRGQLSQGLVLPLSHYPEAEQSVNIATTLGIEKYEPPVPLHMNSDSTKGGLVGQLLHYDIENWKKLGHLLTLDHMVTISEKIHGTLLQVAYLSCDVEDGFGTTKKVVVSSKGLSTKGQYITDPNNLYVSIAHQRGLITFVERYGIIQGARRVILLGEIYGPVQDLKYGLASPSYAAFDLFIEDHSGHSFFIHGADLPRLLTEAGIQCVPILCGGFYHPMLPDLYVSGPSLVAAHHGEKQIREGIVIRAYGPPTKYTQNGRLVLKHISPEYLLRAEGSEYT